MITPAQVSPFVHLSDTHLLMAFVYLNSRQGQLDPIRIDWCNVCDTFPLRLTIADGRIAHCLLFKLCSLLEHLHLRTKQIVAFQSPILNAAPN